MSNSRSLILYEEGLTTLLELCEQSYGPHGKPILINSTENDEINPTKISSRILGAILTYTNNPLVKITLNYAIEQNKIYGDHTFYLIILALNIYSKLKKENLCHSSVTEKISELENLIEKHLLEQGRFHKSFERNFDFLVQLSMSIVKPKLFGYSLLKLESFCRFVVAALLQSLSDVADLNPANWIEPKVLTIPLISIDPYKYGEIYEGILFPIFKNNKLKSYLQRVIELRSFVTYELLYKEKRNLNSILMVYDNSKICETIYDQIAINKSHNLPSVKQIIVEFFEKGFIELLEKANVGLIIVQNEMNGNLRSKLSDRSIFLLDGVDKNLIQRTSRLYNVEVVTSLKIEDTESYVFQVELPTIRFYQTIQYLSIPKPGIITLIFYKLLDSNSQLNEMLTNLIFQHLSKLIFEKPAHSLTNLCHGAGCTEFLLAGFVLRSIGHDRISTSFLIPKAEFSHSKIQSSISESLIKLWQLTRDPVNDPDICNQNDDLLTICQKNFSCVCGHLRQTTDFRSHNIYDFTSIKASAVKNALRLVNILMSTDSVILQNY